MGAEEFEAGSHAPVEERSFFEVADAVGVEGDPVVAEEHFACDFRVDRVCVIEERWGEEGEAGVEGEPEEEDGEAIVAAEVGAGGVGWREWVGYGLHSWGAATCGVLLVECMRGEVRGQKICGVMGSRVGLEGIWAVASRRAIPAQVTFWVWDHLTGQRFEDDQVKGDSLTFPGDFVCASLRAGRPPSRPRDNQLRGRKCIDRWTCDYVAVGGKYCAR